MAAAQYRRDKKLVRQAQAGDTRAFGQLYVIYYHYVHNIVYGLLGTTQEAEEVTQEVFIKAHRNVAALKNPAGFQKWLSTIARSTSFDYLRKKQRAPVETGDRGLEAANSDMTHSMPSPEDEVFDHERSAGIRQIIDELPQTQRDLVMLHYLEGRSGKEIAEQTGSNTSAVYSSLHKARKSFKDRFLEFQQTGVLTVFGIPLTRAAREAAKRARGLSGSEVAASGKAAGLVAAGGSSSHANQVLATVLVLLLLSPVGAMTYSNIRYGGALFDFGAFAARVMATDSLAGIPAIFAPPSYEATQLAGAGTPFEGFTLMGGNSDISVDEAVAGDDVESPGEAALPAGDAGTQGNGDGGSRSGSGSSAGGGSSSPAGGGGVDDGPNNGAVIPPVKPPESTYVLSLAPQTVSLLSGEQRQFTATVEDEQGNAVTDKQLIWSLEDAASIFTFIDTAGTLYLCPDEPAERELTVEVCLGGDATTCATAKVLVASPQDTLPVEPSDKTVMFAGANWLVLAKDADGNSLIVREQAVGSFVRFGASGQYASNSDGAPDTLRTAMADFYDSLSAADKAKVQPTDALEKIEGVGSALDDARGRSQVSATGAKVAFPLSRYEAAQYLDTGDDRVLYREDGVITEAWWLRSPGVEPDLASFVLSDGSICSSYSMNPVYMVRPALWVKL